MLNSKQLLGREQMKLIIAGSSTTCEEFVAKTGCYPTVGGSTCAGKDGKTYSATSSSGSCG